MNALEAMASMSPIYTGPEHYAFNQAYIQHASPLARSIFIACFTWNRHAKSNDLRPQPSARL